MTYTVRKMKDNDIAQVQYVAKVSWNATYEGIIPLSIQANFLKLAYSDEMMKRRLETSTIFVAEFDGKVAGFANYSPVSEDGKVELGAIYLIPDHQGKGAGTALLKKGIDELEGVREIFINVEKDNEIGKTFYDAKGFEFVSEFDDDFDGHILKTIRMVLQVK
ncbi:GNAT family N-acetyltransferase [Virgibacillus sp. C22-A2]|uniref:GNAT family N-acetyltransferase n=1 Tax=Virgibacillus tibetensis TaxID=3042313 RepID=A0ABU6KK61_9BACI|nr:GNAT family N-acetyltransferase [Virgibacillus sp. C22-A2]